MFNNNRADYIIVEETDRYIYIEDLDLGNRSVTNDVNNVVADLLGRLNGRQLYYRDSMGRIDEIVVSDGVFYAFYAVGNQDLSRLRKHYQK